MVRLAHKALILTLVTVEQNVRIFLKLRDFAKKSHLRTHGGPSLNGLNQQTRYLQAHCGESTYLLRPMEVSDDAGRHISTLDTNRKAIIDTDALVRGPTIYQALGLGLFGPYKKACASLSRPVVLRVTSCMYTLESP